MKEKVNAQYEKGKNAMDNLKGAAFKKMAGIVPKLGFPAENEKAVLDALNKGDKTQIKD